MFGAAARGERFISIIPEHEKFASKIVLEAIRKQAMRYIEVSSCG